MTSATNQIRVMLLQFNSPYFAQLASALSQTNLDIKYLLTSNARLYNKFKIKKSTEIVDESNFYLADSIVKLNTRNLKSLDDKFILKNRELEATFLRITDRLSYTPKTVKFRQKIYYELLLYWKTFFEDNNFDVVIFPRVPHLGYDNIIYAIAKQFNVKTIVIIKTLLDNKVYLTTDFMKTSKVSQLFSKNENIFRLNKKLPKSLVDQLSVDSAHQDFDKVLNKEILESNKSGFFEQLKELFSLKTLTSIKSLIHNPFERYVGTFVYLEKPINWLAYYGILIRHFFYARNLLKIYSGLSKKASMSKNFIYFPLHLQPESTTLPEGGVYEDQLLIIDILSKSLPKGWWLYVKEHPTQFARSDPRRNNFRDKEFYLKIKGYKNVKLLPLSTDPDLLIEKSRGVATVTGTSGWEALKASRPVILFTSSTWYAPCRSCYVVSSKEKCVDAIEHIKKSSARAVKADLLKFLLYSRKNYIDSVSFDALANRSTLPTKTLIKNLSDALVKYSNTKIY